MIGTSLCALVALSFSGLGLGSYIAPRTLAANYGLPVDDALGVAYVRAVGTRDLVLGLVVGALLVGRAPRPTLAATIGLSALVGAADFTLVATTAGAQRRALPIHAGGTLGLIVLWRLLRLDG